MWMEVKAFEERCEQELAHERTERRRLQGLADNVRQLLASTEEMFTELQQEVHERQKEVADQNKTIEELTLRLQAEEARRVKEVNAQDWQAKAEELSRSLELAKQRLDTCEGSGRELAAQLDDSERRRQADLASHEQEKENLQSTLQARLDEQACQHDAASKNLWKQYSELQVQLARKEADLSTGQDLLAELRVEAEETEASYLQGMVAIAQALHHPLIEKIAAR